MAARAVYREFSIYKNTVKHGVFACVGFGGNFRFFYNIREAPEVSKNLPGSHGFVVIQYEPVASHGDPIHPPNYEFSMFVASKTYA